MNCFLPIHFSVLVSSRDVLKTAINVIDEAVTSDLENEEKDEVKRKGGCFVVFLGNCSDWPIASFLH